MVGEDGAVPVQHINLQIGERIEESDALLLADIQQELYVSAFICCQRSTINLLEQSRSREPAGRVDVAPHDLMTVLLKCLGGTLGRERADSGK